MGNDPFIIIIYLEDFPLNNTTGIYDLYYKKVKSLLENKLLF